VTFVGRDNFRWSLVQPHDLAPEWRHLTIDPSAAASQVARWCDDVDVWPLMLQVYEGLSGSLFRALSARDIRASIEPALREALERGHIVALREPIDGVVVRPPPEAPKPAPRPKLATVSRDKHFLDVTLKDENGAALAGRRFRLQLPDARKEEGYVDVAGRIFRADVPEGTAWLWIVADKGAAVDAEDAPPASSSPVPLKLRLRILGPALRPFASTACELDGESVTTEAGGMVENAIDGTAKEGSFTAHNVDLSLRIAESLEGDDAWNARLYNLGFLLDPDATEGDGEMTFAVADFQAEHGLRTTGTLDGPTKDALVDAYGC